MKNVVKILVGLLAVAGVSAAVSYVVTRSGYPNAGFAENYPNQPVKLVSANAPSGIETDFTLAAEQSINAVVHISARSVRVVNQPNDLLEYFFGYGGQQQRRQPMVGIGSGVIISPDGYIITNHHVIEGAEEITVSTNDNRIFKAKIIGSDPSTEVALIKVDANDLPSIPIGNSDNLKVGEWVLAVGNPWNLSSTVTAGIVSAKGRSLGIIGGDELSRSRGQQRRTLGLESFIQTDAVVNEGNSGGALVNLRGELVGINTAIITQTGSYSGYSLAIPVNIVARVVSDIKQFGAFQRPYLGVSIRDIDSNFANEKNISTRNGVYVDAVEEKSGAMEAGLKQGDVIVEVGGTPVKKTTELQEQVSRFHPGDKVDITYLRDNKERTVSVKLRNRQGGTDIVKDAGLEILGATFKELNNEQRRQFNVSSGLQVSGITEGKLKEADVTEGYIILRANNRSIRNVSELESVLKSAQQGTSVEDRVLLLVGIYPNGRRAYYAIDMN